MEEAEEFNAETGIDLGFLVVLWQDTRGLDPDVEDAIAYAENIDEEPTEPDMFVGADETVQVFDSTPYEGRALPGKCVLSPDMVMIDCHDGHGNSKVFDAVLEHAGAR